MSCPKVSPLSTLSIAIGANLPSKFGDPESTLVAIRPKIEQTIYIWSNSCTTGLIEEEEKKAIDSFRFRWSPLYETDAIGGPPNQPNFVNAVVVVDGNVFSTIKPTKELAHKLLVRLLSLEKIFGRDRTKNEIPWGPRIIDIDLISWGALQIQTKELTLPHPRMTERTFVLVPLAAALSSTEGNPREIITRKDWST